LEHYEAVATPTGFPYGSVLVPTTTRDPRYTGVAFLAQASPDQFSIDHLGFYYQCTLGFLMDDAIDILSDLASRYFAVQKEPDTVAPMVALARTVSPSLQNYLFLFLYSAATRHSRKVGTLFILRQAFQDVRGVLTREDLAMLDTWMRVHHAGSVEEYEYFRTVHFDEVSSSPQQKFKKQSLWDVGRIPFRKSERRVFVEFRGFQTLLNDKVGKGLKTIARVRAALS
jgi:hypothetical protein